MNIIYDEENRTFKLDTDNTSYVLGLFDEAGYIGHVYYGAGIKDSHVSKLTRAFQHPHLPSQNPREKCAFMDFFPTEYSSNGVGDYRESAVCVQDAHGHEAVLLQYKGHAIYAGKKPLKDLPASFGTKEDTMTLELVTEDPATKVEVTLFYSIFKDSDVIARHAEIKNVGKEVLKLKRAFSFCMDMDDKNYEMLTMHGSWARERQMERRAIAYGKQLVSSIKGETSHQEHPFVAVLDKHADYQQGEVYGFQFVYSGNFLAQVEKNQFDNLRIVMGIHPEKFEFLLNEKECFTTPEVLFTYSNSGLGKMSRSFHDLIRNHIIRSPYNHKKRPVLINNWEATYFDFDTDKLVSIAKTAKEHGIEMLVMDDGWFGERNDDNSSLGDWQVNENKLQGGLKHLVDRVNDLGLKFGIWFEPEMVSPKSKLFEAHPDWAIQIPGREPVRSRNQLVLDITRPEVWDYVYGMVSDVLRSANIEYVKWDMNRQLTDIGSYYLGEDRQGELMHRYVLAMYRMQERLITDFPNLLLENCSGGGGRFDAGMLYYSPQIWCSDDTDAIERLSIQEGTALLYPLSSMGAHVSDCPNHIVGRVTPFETRGIVALAGTFGYELDITRISPEDRAQIPQQIACYHKYNDLVREGDYYRIASYRENQLYDCYEVVAKDQSEALVTFVQVYRRPNKKTFKIQIPGLHPDKQYRVEGEDRLYYGDTLMYAGILVPEMTADYQARLIHIQEVKA